MNDRYNFTIIYALKDNEKSILLYGYLIPYLDEWKHSAVNKRKQFLDFYIQIITVTLDSNQANQVIDSLNDGSLDLSKVIKDCNETVEFYSKKQIIQMNDRRLSTIIQSPVSSVADTTIFHADINIQYLRLIAKKNSLTLSNLILKLLKVLDQNTDFDFLGQRSWSSIDSGRLGCFEVYSFRLINNQMQFLLDIDNNQQAATLAKSYNKAIICNLVLFDETNIFFDELINLNHNEDSKVIKFEGNSLSYELKIYLESGILIYQEAFEMLEQINTYTGVILGTKKINDKLSKRANSVSKDDGSIFVEVNSQFECKDEIRMNSKLFSTNRNQLLELLPKAGLKKRSFYFQQGNEGRIRALEEILMIINDPKTSNIFIADPFINDSILESILERVQNSEKNISILTSYDDDLESKDRNPRISKIVKLWESKYLKKRNWDLNITYNQNNDKASRNFHDRYLLYQTEQKFKGLLLSNSLSSIGTNWSFTMAELDRDVIEEILLIHEGLLNQAVSIDDILVMKHFDKMFESR